MILLCPSLNVRHEICCSYRHATQPSPTALLSYIQVLLPPAGRTNFNDAWFRHTEDIKLLSVLYTLIVVTDALFTVFTTVMSCTKEENIYKYLFKKKKERSALKNNLKRERYPVNLKKISLLIRLSVVGRSNEVKFWETHQGHMRSRFHFHTNVCSYVCSRHSGEYSKIFKLL